MRPGARATVAAVALGAGTTWNMSSVGAIADPTASAYDTSLIVVGLFTTALVLTHFLVQIPAGSAADRYGAVRVGFAAASLCVVGNAIGLLAADPSLAIAGRLVTGLGSGAGFLAGAELMRAAGFSIAWQGAYGASTVLGGGLAVAIVPQLEPSLGWRAPYVSGLAIATAIVLAVATAPKLPRARPVIRGARAVIDRRLVPLGIIHAATFGVGYIAANWIVPLLERQGFARRDAALLGALVLLGGVVTRIGGGVIAARAPRWVRPAVLAALAGCVVAAAALALPLPLSLPLLGLATLLAGLCAGLPFAPVFGAAQRLRPDAPAGALAFVNSFAIAVLLVGTPLAGAAFSLPGGGRIAFAAIAILSALALIPARRARV